jgi:hypothetical protein
MAANVATTIIDDDSNVNAIMSENFFMMNSLVSIKSKTTVLLFFGMVQGQEAL